MIVTFSIFWILGLAHASPEFFDDVCYVFFDGNSMLWTLPTHCGEILGYYIDFLYGCSLMLFIFCIDIITVIFLRRARNRIKTANDRIRLGRDIGYFAQTFATTWLVIGMDVSYYVITPMMPEKWGYYFTTTIVWDLFHALDG
uniref:7TM GPCR serpentine receptor class x (Srx) domain-containing protein n=1 Tax=Acrobeloides nanus TaxID=290746 RepID=A0A914EPS4_9BILA